MNSDQRNSAWLATQHALFLLTSLVNLRLNLATFGREHFDVWLIFASLWGAGSALDFGFGVAVVSLIARGMHDGDRRLVEGVIATGLVMFSAAGLLLVGGGHALAGALFFPDSTLVPPGFSDARSVFSLLGVSFFFQYLSIFFRSIVEGTEDFVGSSRIAMANSVVVTVGVVITFVLHLSMVWLAGLYAGAAAIQAIAFVLLARERLPGYRLAAGIRPEILRRLLGTGVAIQATYVLGALIDPVVKYVLGHAGPSGSVSVYEIARRFSLAVSGLFASAFRNHLPKTSVLRLRGELKNYLSTEGAQLISVGVRYASITFGAFSLVLVMFMVYLYESPESLLFFFILAMCETMNICGYMSYVFLLGTGRAALLILVQSVNILCAGAGLLLGYRLTGTPIGLLLYPVGIFIGNVFMVVAIRRKTDVQFGDLMSHDRLIRLSGFMLCLGANVCVVAAGLQPVILWQVGFAVLTGVIFRSDAVVAYDLIRGMIFRPRGLAGKV